MPDFDYSRKNSKVCYIIADCRLKLQKTRSKLISPSRIQANHAAITVRKTE